MANRTNTVATGDKFEDVSYDLIDKLLNSGKLGVLSECAKLFKKKAYYSHHRKKDIIFDLTIEIWLPEATKYSMLYIIECKDYAQRIPIDRVEAFHSKINQVAGVNVKGVFISNSPFQESAYNYAESIGMMLIQAESTEDYQIILHRRGSTTSSNRFPILRESIDDSVLNGTTLQLSDNIESELLNLFLVPNKDHASYGIEWLSQEEIKLITEIELNKINPNILMKGHGLEVKAFKDFLTTEYSLKFVTIKESENKFGYCDLLSNEIGISELIINTPRELFVLAHEFGHYILHQKLSIGQQIYNSFDDASFNFKTGRKTPNNPRHWIEWQANSFASSLTLPTDSIKWVLHKFLTSRGLKYGPLHYNDDQLQSFKNDEIVKLIAHHFNVSNVSVKYKLNQLNLLKNHSRLKSVGSIIFENREELML